MQVSKTQEAQVRSRLSFRRPGRPCKLVEILNRLRYKPRRFPIFKWGRTTTFIAGIFILIPQAASAQIPIFNEFLVEGNFDIVAKTFLRIGLIASDGGYQALFFGLAVGGLLFLGWMTLKKSLVAGNPGDWVNAVFRFCFGVCLYMIFVTNTSTFSVRDVTNNKFITVSGIPDGIALVALMGNAIEQGLINIIETSATPDGYGEGYQENPHGIVFKVLSSVMSGEAYLMGTSGTDANGELNKKNFQSYMRDCVLFEMARPGATITIETINNTTDLASVIASAASPAVSTWYYSEANKGGDRISCFDAWGRVNAYLGNLSETHAAVTRYWEDKCSQAGFAERVSGASGNNMIEQCKRKVTGLTSDLAGAAVSSAAIFRNMLVAKELHKVLRKEDPATAINLIGGYQTATHYISRGIMTAEWLPRIKAILYVVFLGSSVFLIVLLATPMYNKVVGFLVGFFVFFICWSCCDAILHESAMDAAMDVFREIRAGSLGYRSMLLLEAESLRALSAFAPYQAYAFLMASVIAGGLVKFGGSALSRIGVMQMEGIRSEAQTAANRVTEPSGMATSLEGFANSAPALAAHAMYQDQMFRHRQFSTMAKEKTTAKAIGTYDSATSAANTAARTRNFNLTKDGINLNNMENAYGEVGAPYAAAEADLNRTETSLADREGWMRASEAKGEPVDKLRGNAAFNRNVESVSRAEANREIGRNDQGIATIEQAKADIKAGEGAGEVFEANQNGFMKTDYGMEHGRNIATKKMANIDVANTIGRGQMRRSESQSEINQAALHNVTQPTLDYISRTGAIPAHQRETNKKWANSPNQQERIGVQNISKEIALDPESRKQWANYLGVSENRLPEAGGNLAVQGHINPKTGNLEATNLEATQGDRLHTYTDSTRIDNHGFDISSGAARALFADTENMKDIANHMFTDNPVRDDSVAFQVAGGFSAGSGTIYRHGGSTTGKANVGGGVKVSGSEVVAGINRAGSTIVPGVKGALSGKTNAIGEGASDMLEHYKIPKGKIKGAGKVLGRLTKLGGPLGAAAKFVADHTHVNAGVGYENAESESYDLNTIRFLGAYQEAKEAHPGNIEAQKAHFLESYNELVGDIKGDALRKTDLNFGADAPVGATVDGVSAVGRGTKKVIDSAVDGAKKLFGDENEEN